MAPKVLRRARRLYLYPDARPWWSRPLHADVCSMFARMPRYGPAGPGTHVTPPRGVAAMSINVRALAADDEQSAQEALSEHPQPDRVRELVRMLVEKVEADPARLRAAAAAARS